MDARPGVSISKLVPADGVKKIVQEIRELRKGATLDKIKIGGLIEEGRHY